MCLGDKGMFTSALVMNFTTYRIAVRVEDLRSTCSFRITVEMCMLVA